MVAIQVPVPVPRSFPTTCTTAHPSIMRTHSTVPYRKSDNQQQNTHTLLRQKKERKKKVKTIILVHKFTFPPQQQTPSRPGHSTENGPAKQSQTHWNGWAEPPKALIGGFHNRSLPSFLPSSACAGAPGSWFPPSLPSPRDAVIFFRWLSWFPKKVYLYCVYLRLLPLMPKFDPLVIQSG